MGLHPSVVTGLTTVGMWVGGAGSPNQAVPHARAVGLLEGQVGFLQNWLHRPREWGVARIGGTGSKHSCLLGPGAVGADASLLVGRARSPHGCLPGPRGET